MVKILVVDDSSICRSMTCKTLVSICEKEQYLVQCEQADCGKTAITMVQNKFNNNVFEDINSIKQEQQHLAQKQPPNDTADTSADANINADSINNYDIILIDYEMPVMNGSTTIHSIRELGYQGKIIGLTGSSETRDIDRMTQAGADVVLLKPLTSSRLMKLKNV